MVAGDLGKAGMPGVNKDEKWLAACKDTLSQAQEAQAATLCVVVQVGGHRGEGGAVSRRQPPLGMLSTQRQVRLPLDGSTTGSMRSCSLYEVHLQLRAPLLAFRSRFVC